MCSSSRCPLLSSPVAHPAETFTQHWDRCIYTQDTCLSCRIPLFLPNNTKRGNERLIEELFHTRARSNSRHSCNNALLKSRAFQPNFTFLNHCILGPTCDYFRVLAASHYQTESWSRTFHSAIQPQGWLERVSKARPGGLCSDYDAAPLSTWVCGQLQMCPKTLLVSDQGKYVRPKQNQKDWMRRGLNPGPYTNSLSY